MALKIFMHIDLFPFFFFSDVLPNITAVSVYTKKKNNLGDFLVLINLNILKRQQKVLINDVNEEYNKIKIW